MVGITSKNNKIVPVFPAAFGANIPSVSLAGTGQIYEFIQRAPAGDHCTRRRRNNRGEIEENM